MTIAVCDDEKEFLEIIHNEMVNVFMANDFEANILIYDNAVDLIEYAENKDLDAAFLDIDMPEISGFELSEKLRLYSENTQIIFVTAYEIFMHKAFDFRPFGYVRKNNLRDELTSTTKRLMRYLEKSNIYVEFHNRKENVRWRLSQIYYFESSNNDIIVYSKMGEFKFRGNISEQENQFNKYGFVLINRGLLVNWRYVVKMCKSHVTLSNTIQLPISKNRYTEVEKEYLIYNDILF